MRFFIHLVISVLIVPPFAGAAENPELARIRAEWEKARAQKIREIDLRYLPRLREMQARLMKADDIDGAFKVGAEIKAVEASLSDAAGAKGDRLVLQVPAAGYSRKLIGTGKVRITPNPKSKWNSSPDRWRDADFRGHRRENERADNGMSYMTLCYKMGNGKLIAIPDAVTDLEINGEFVLGPSDMEGGGRIDNNTGSIELVIEGQFRLAD